MSDNQFKQLGLNKNILTALAEIGFEAPSPIQEKTIPILMSGEDIIAQAQTGTGKTAAFALPILNDISVKDHKIQALVLAPTRELAIQVAENFKSYAKHIPDFRVVPIYGGADYSGQLRALKRGVQVVVGTPGRVMDHLRRGSLTLEGVKTMVLDEGDEMLKMGFEEDVEWILKQIPCKHQTALFSATMPASIQKIANKYLNNPTKIHIKSKAMTSATIDQGFMMVSRNNKLEALTRFLEIEDLDATLIFTRTKNSTIELAEKLEARGYAAAALNGDMSQSLREKVIQRIKRHSLDVIVATDVAARGLDVERINHVINYDAPYDPETYVHRIGRTGRAGRTGKSLLLVNPREQHLLRDIERTTNQAIKAIEPPTANQLRKRRIESFIGSVVEALNDKHLDYYKEVVDTITHQTEHSRLDVAAALVSMIQKDKPLHVKDDKKPLTEDAAAEPNRRRRPGGGARRSNNQSNRKFAEKRKSSRKKASRGNATPPPRNKSKAKSKRKPQSPKR